MAFKKRGQISIFMIASLIVVLAGVIYFFYQGKYFGSKPEIVHPDVEPIKVYVENCLKEISQDGLERVGLSGGYIKIPENLEKDPRAYLAIFPASGFKMPYWWHDGIESVPTEDFIKGQLESYIKSELKNCISNFEPFSGRFDIKEPNGAAASVQFNQEDVSVNLKYPLEIAKKDGSSKYLIENFNYVAPIRFRKAYELAKLIMKRENKEYFLEEKTIDLYSMDRQIPTTDIEPTCKTRVWNIANVKKELMNVLRVNLPYIRIKGTDYNPNLYVPNPYGKSAYSESYFQSHYIWDIGKDAEIKYKNMKVAFAYENWPLNIYARPSENGILKSNSQKGTDLLSFLCLHIWHFTYDISYPAVVTIFDPETEKNRAYRFNFGFKVSIDHNQPKRSGAGTFLFETDSEPSSEDYCKDAQNEITIFTVNNATGEDIKGVNLTFACGRSYCGMGQSDWLSLGAAAGITKKFPYCVNGIIKGTKDGFSDSKSFIQTDTDGKSYVLTLSPIKEFKNYKIVKHLLPNPSVAQELSPGEKASILIKGKELGFDTFAVYPKEEGFKLSMPGSRDGTYDLSIYIADEENIVGGYIGEWKVSKEELFGSSEVIFHAIEQGPASDDEKFLFISGLDSYSKRVPPPELR